MNKITKQQKVHNFNNIILDYKHKWAQNVLMINDTRISKWLYRGTDKS